MNTDQRVEELCAQNKNKVPWQALALIRFMRLTYGGLSAEIYAYAYACYAIVIENCEDKGSYYKKSTIKQEHVNFLLALPSELPACPALPQC